MDFLEIARARQSCRSYDTERPVEQEKLDSVMSAWAGLVMRRFSAVQPLI